LKIESGEKQIEMINSLEDRCIVSANRTMTSGILRNLLTNAIKFTDKRGRVEVSAAREAAFWRLFITDNGIGMESSETEILFRIDKQFRNYGTNEEPGSGYGLILTSQFIKSNGGTISVSSEKGKGTTVSFTLPAIAQ
jgi:signal transduction histidine kinase